MPIDYTDKNLYPYGKEGIQPGQPYIPYGGSINSSSLAPQQDLSSQVSSPTYPSAYPILNKESTAQFGATPTETDISKSIAGKNANTPPPHTGGGGGRPTKKKKKITK